MSAFTQFKIIIFSLSVLIISFVFPVKSFATSINFIKDSQNPLNTDFYILQSTVTKDDGLYKMWFTGHNGSNLRIGYSTSLDGVNWPTYNFVTVNDTGDNHDPSLFEKDGNRYLYYISEPAEGSGVDIKVRRALVNDSTLVNSTQINLPRQSWNSQKLSCPYVYFENGSYFLFYCGTSGSGWSLGMATSDDGINFTPCTYNPIIAGGDIGNTQIYVDENDTRHLIFHSSGGITEAESTGPLSCSSSWSNFHTLISRDKPYDQTYIITPTLLNNLLPKELFYTAKGPATTDNWKLNKATEKIRMKPKIVIIPGFFASWNGEAILHNKSVPLGGWKIPTYIREYDGLIKSLENTGLSLNDDFYIFAYDWRKPISDSADDLRQFIQNNIWNFDENNEVVIVGHSMGGVVSRIYAQKYPDDRITKVITAGSPHHGVVQVYQPLEAGEVQRDNSLLWLGTKLLINLNRKLFDNDRITVQRIIPSLYDLFPTFDFLKKSNGEYRSVESLNIKNSLLPNYSDIGLLDNKMTVIYGNKSISSSPIAFKIESRALLDRINGDYIDGRPIKTFYSSGDYLVPTISSITGSNTKELALDHGEIIYSNKAIRKILESLSLNFQDNEIKEGAATQLSSSLIFAIQSPVEVNVQSENSTYTSEDGLIFIPNAQSGNYNLKVKKLSPGEYTLTMAQISNQNDIWEQFEGVIEESNVNEEDEYAINFDSEKAKPQISTNKCKKYKKGFLNERRKFKCKIKKIHTEN